MEAKIIAVASEKGGSAKSSTAQALAAGLDLLEHKTLLIDLDPQRNTSNTAEADTNGKTVLDILQGDVDARTVIQHCKTWDVIPASKNLAGADGSIIETGKEFRLKEGLEPVLGDYSFIVLDTPPALGILTVNALAAAHEIVIPCQASIYDLDGAKDLADTMRPVKKYCNPGLHIAGILLTRYSPRSVLNREAAELAERMAAKLGTKVFSTKIREAVAIKEAQISRKSIFEYAPRSKVAGDYRSFVEELLESI